MKIGRCCAVSLVLCVITLSFCLERHVIPTASAAVTMPNKLEIARTPSLNGQSNSSYEEVLQASLVQKLYAHILTLPAAPTDQICPMYLIANYQLTFLHNNASVLYVNAVNGECQPVIFRSGDVRTADQIFWKLLNLAQNIGTKPIKGLALPTSPPQTPSLMHFHVTSSGLSGTISSLKAAGTHILSRPA